jgi:osmotically inducible lipoprotein OsmB
MVCHSVAKAGLRPLVLLACLAALAGCGETSRDRTVSGGLMGAGTGAVLGGLTTGTVAGTMLGATLGGIGGAVIGYASAPHRCTTTDRYGYPHRVRC